MTGSADGDAQRMMMVNRLHARHSMLVDEFRHVVADSSVLHLGAEDGRWCYTFASAGALQVVGIEASAELVRRFERYPDVGLRERIELRCASYLEEVEAEVAADRQYDVVALFDVLEEVADPARLIAAVSRLRPRLVIVDGEFVISDEPVIQLVSTPSHPDIRKLPSPAALAAMADAAGLEPQWLDWTRIPEDARIGLSDYYRVEGRKRASAILVPGRLSS